MTDLLSDIETPSDAELISRVRGGDVAAYGELFARHVGAANRLARQLVRGSDADDLVSEAFAKVLHVLQSGGGPDVAFRAYLLTAVRRLHVDRVRATARLQTTDDLTPFDPGVPFQDTAVAGFESGAAAKAFASLPERWQLVLWHLEVEGQKPADIAPLLGMSPNSVSALAYRAREGLRQAFLTMHLSDISETDCRWVNEHLGAFVRHGLSKRDTTKVQAHLDDCRRCTAMYLELTDVNSNLAGIIGPLLLGAAAAGYLTSSGAAGGAAAGVIGVLARAKEVVIANSGAATATAVAAGVAAVATAGFMITHQNPDQQVSSAGQPNGSTSLVAPGGPSTGPSARASRSPSVRVSRAVVAPSASTGPVALLTPPASLIPSAAPSSVPPSAPSSGPPSPVPPTDTGSPSGGPSGSTPISSDVSVSALDLTSQAGATGLRLQVSGSPALPPTITVALTSTPGGITFAPGGDCAVSPDPTVATCDTTVVARQAARLSAGSGTSYSGFLPLAIPGSQPDTDLQVAVSVPAGYEDPSPGNNSLTFHYHHQTPIIDADVALARPGPMAVHPDAAGDYPVNVEVSGVSGLPQVAYTLSGKPATFADDPAGCTGAGTAVLTCDQPSDGTVPFSVDPADTSRAQPVTITATLPTGYADPDLTNNSVDAVLTPRTRVDVAMGQPDPAAPRPGADGTYTVRSVISGVDPQLPSVTYTLTGAPATFAAAPPGCVLTLPTTIVCDPPSNGPVDFAITSDTTTPADVIISASLGSDDFEDVNPYNNAITVTLTPPVQVEVALGDVSPNPVEANDAGQYLLDIPLSVVGSVPEVDLALSTGVRFADPQPGGCTVVDAQHATCPPTGPLQLALLTDNPGDQSVTVTASLPDGYVDTDSGNDSTTAMLVVSRSLTFVGATTAVPAAAPQQYSVTTQVTGIPSGTHQLTFYLDNPDERFVTPDPACHVAGQGSSKDKMICTVTGQTSFTAAFVARLPGKAAGPDQNRLAVQVTNQPATRVWTTILF